MKYALFLRGINVGGVKVAMADLRDCLGALPVSGVRTFLQTGNVVLETDLPPADLEASFAATVSERFAYKASALVYALDEIGEIVARCPYDASPDRHRYAVLCATSDVVADLASRQMELDPAVEEIAPGERAIYWRVPIGSSTDTAFARILARPAYRSVTTNRNLNTLQSMLRAR